MDGIAMFAIPFLMVAGMQQEAAQRHYPPPHVYSVPAGYGWAPGAVIGTGVGAMATGSAGGALVGGLMGAALGHAATTPPVVVVPVSYAAPSRMALDWNGFMQPSGR